MSRRDKRYVREKNPFLSIIYIVAVIVLLVFIVYCMLVYRKQGSAYQERVQQMISEEEEYPMTEWIFETEEESETEAAAVKKK